MVIIKKWSLEYTAIQRLSVPIVPLFEELVCNSYWPDFGFRRNILMLLDMREVSRNEAYVEKGK